jgi:hypothetical protein
MGRQGEARHSRKRPEKDGGTTRKGTETPSNTFHNTRFSTCKASQELAFTQKAAAFAL